MSEEAAGSGEGLTPQEKSQADVIQAGINKENAGMSSLFGETGPSEAELRGEVDSSNSDKSETTPPSDDDSKGEGSDKQDDKTGEADDKGSDDKSDPKPKADKEDKPDGKGRPDGYVPLAALHEERTARKELQNKLKEMEDRFEKLEKSKNKPEAKEELEPEFKILTKEEFKQLSEDDIFKAIEYQNDLLEYKEKLAKKEREAEDSKKEIERSKRREWEVVNKVADKIRDMVPGIYDDDTDVTTNLTAFAITHGFTPEHIGVLTHPGTRIIPPGSDKPVLLGDAAAAIVGVLHKFYTSETDLRERLEKEITEKIQSEVMSKLKGETKFKSIGDAPGTADKVTGGKRLSEAEFSRLPEAEQRKYLGG